jgi:release factor glutamine methyltransferase
MNWEKYISDAVIELSDYLGSDVQYSNLSKNSIRQIAGREIEMFIQEFKKWTPKDIILNENTNINKKEQEIINKFITKRKQGIPLAYILGRQEFYGLSFKVDKNTLIPRPETEELVERVVNFVSKRFSSNRRPLILIDIGTGSGCIITSVIKNIPTSVTGYKAYAVDSSEKALKLAKNNAQGILGNNKKVTFLKGSLLGFLKHKTIPPKAFLAITANLPYLSEKEYNNLSREVRNNEPGQALMGGQNGHELICKLLEQVSKLNQDGKIFLELSPTVFPAIKQYCASLRRGSGRAKPLELRKFTDINGNIRIIEVKF